MKTHSAPEALEARIAPAILFTFADVDGDIATVNISRGQAGDATFLVDAGQLQSIDLTNPVFNGANVTITAKSSDGFGDGRVNVGYINASGVALGNVTVSGDLGHINAGLGTAETAVKNLTVASLGALGTSTQAPGGGLGSALQGSVGTVKVLGDVVGVHLGFTGVAELTVGSVNIGGSFDGSQLFCAGTLGSLKIGGSVLGSSVNSTGAIIGHKMGSVFIGGSLAAGDGAATGVLQADQIGSVKIGGSLEGGAGNFGAEILVGGRVGSLTIGGDILGTAAMRSGYVEIGGGSGAIRIGGSIEGSLSANSGQVKIGGPVGSFFLGGSLEGGVGSASGRLDFGGKVGSLFVGGSVLGSVGGGSGSIEGIAKLGSGVVRGDIEGGDGQSSGKIVFGSAKSFTIGGSVIGGAGNYTGKIIGAVKSYVVGGSLIGGTGDGSGLLSANGSQTIKIAGDIVGGSTTMAGQVLSRSGGLFFDGSNSARSIVIGGSIFAGTEFPGSTLTDSGGIHAGHLEAIVVKGSIIGSETTPVIISAEGGAPAGATTDLAIKSLTVGGAVSRTSVLAGYDYQGLPVNADAQIGTVNVGTWQESNLVAGVEAGADKVFGTDDDAKISGGSAQIQSRIASFIVKGQATGSVMAGNYFGVVAQQIGTVKIGATTKPFTAAPNEVFRIGATGGAMGDFFAREDV